MRTVHSFQGFASAAEARTVPYRYLAFPVPPRCQRIAASYQFDPQGNGPCTVDIGIFDIRGTDPLTGGFRGWSGSARRAFFIAEASATPGYLPGPLPSGDWQIVLGLYQIPEPGVRWWVTVEVDHGAAALLQPGTLARRRPSPIPRPSSRRRWHRGDFHSHSEHSDGANTISEIAAFASRRGLDFLAITDHNTVSHHAEIDSRRWPLLLIPGEEVTTYTGHANVWGLREWVDFRITSDEEMHRLHRWVDSRGAPFSINHPKSVGPPWLYTDPGFAIREVWQAPWRWYNWESVRDWDEVLAARRRVTPVGGSDAHSVPPAEARHPHDLGDPTTWVLCQGPLSERSILDAVVAGRTSISESPDGPFVALEGDREAGPLRVRYRRAAGCDLVLVADGELRLRNLIPRPDGAFALPRDLRFDRYVRAELRSPGAFPGDHEITRALSAPAYRGA